MSVFDHKDFDGHEDVVFCHDESVGLRAIIAIHSTALGPAAGGCRMMPYASVDEALTDVLRLSKGMTYKSALAGLPLGGGKSVIIADPASPQKADVLRAFGRHVQALGGRYWTAIGVGVGPADVDVVAQTCDYVFARASQYPPGFNPAHYTALGGLTGIQAVVEHLRRHGRLPARDDASDLHGIRVAVQGLGAAGFDLARQLHEAGAALVVADIRDEPVAAAVREFGAIAVPAQEIHAQEVDVFAPCALGAVIDDVTLPELRTKAVCGLANNQLAHARHGQALRERGIAYVPDYVVNAGGMMGASTVIYATPSDEAARRRIGGLAGTILDLLDEAEAQGRPTSDVADDLAKRRIAEANPAPQETR